MNISIRPLRSALIAAALLTAAVVPAALAQDFGPNAAIHIGSLYEPQNLDNTAGAGQGINEAFNGNVYEALFQLTDAGTVIPQLSDSYSVSADGLTYTFKLKPGVTFHSGDKLTSADVKSSIERVIAANSKSSRKSSLKTIASIETPDDATVVIKLSAKSISLPYNLSYVWIVDHKAADITSTEGTGPYTLEEWRRGSALALKAFAGYWGTKPTNAEVVFQYFTDATALNNALLTNAVDVITSVQSPDSLAQFKSNPAYTVSNGQSTTKLLLAFNDKVAPFDNVKVRKAIARAIDDKKLLQSIWGTYGSLIGSFVPPTDPWYENLTGVDPYDPASAKQFLTEAGFPSGFSFTLDHSRLRPASGRGAVHPERTGQGRRDGQDQHHHRQRVVHKVYQKHDFAATLQEHVNHRDIVFYGNPDFYWGYNNSPAVTKLIADSEAAATTDEQTADLKKANEIIANDAASDWLYLYPQIVVSSSKVTGYPVNGLNSQFFVYGIKKAK